MKPQIIKTAAPLVAESYSTTGVTMGTFDATNAGANNALILLVPHSAPTTNANDKVTGVSFDGVAGVLIGTKSANSTNALQPRISAYVVANPNKVVGNIVVTSNINLADASSQCAVYPILISNVSTSNPIGNVVTTYTTVSDTDLNDTTFTATMSLQSSNPLLIGAYVGLTAGRNAFTPVDPTVTYYTGNLNYPVNPDQPFWVGTQDIVSSGAKFMGVTQTTYGDTAALLFFEVLCSTPAPMITLPYTINVGSTVTATFSNVAVIPSSVTLTSGGLSQPVSVTNTGGTYSLAMPDFTANLVKMGFGSITFTDSGQSVVAEFTYAPGTGLTTTTLTSAASSASYPGWSAPPVIGDQIVWPVATTVVDKAGEMDAYTAGTYNFKYINGATGETHSYNVTFGDLPATTIVPSSSTQTLVHGSSGILTFSPTGVQFPVDVRLRDTASDAVAKQSSVVWNPTTRVVTYGVNKGAVAYNKQIELIALMNDGSILTLPVTVTGDAIPVYDKTVNLSANVSKNATSPLIDGLNTDGRR